MTRWLFCCLALICASHCESRVAAAEASPVVGRIRPNLLGFNVDARSAWLMTACYDSILTWKHVLDEKTRPVPNARDFLYLGDGGNEENAIRPVTYAALVHAFVAAVETPSVIDNTVEQTSSRKKAIGLIRYLTSSHVTSSGTCVNGKRWGNQWQSAMWARSLGLAAWLVWPELPADLQREVSAVITFEADRFVAASPKSSVRNDTGAEENAWNAQILSLAACMFPQHPRATEWETAAKRWMYNSLSVAADQSNPAKGDDDKPVKEWVTTTNVHSDFTIENHGIVHIGYLKTSASLLVENAIPYLLTGRKIPAAATHHATDCFNVLLRCMAWDGSAIYVSGNDWKLVHTQSTDAMLYTFMNVLNGDSRAALLEEIALDYTLRIQRLERGYYNVRRDLESGGLSAARLIAAYFAHAALGPGANPVSEKKFNQSISGQSHFRDGNFAVHRTPTKFVSACLSQKRMLLTLPEDGNWVIWPHFASGLGYVNGEDASAQHAKLLNARVETNRNDFRVSAVLSRADGAVEQSFACISLPDDVVVYVERLRIKQLESREGGVVGVEYDLGNNSRTVFTGEGAIDLVGVGGDSPRVRVWTSDWLNIDNRIGYVVKHFPERTNVMRYHDEVAGSGRVPKLEEWLSLVGEADARELEPGDYWACIVTTANQDAARTQRLAAKTRFTVAGNVAECRIDKRRLSVELLPE